MIQTIFDGIGIRLPAEIYGDGNFYTEWIDTSESERLLKYQRHSLTETVNELSEKLKFIKILLLPIRPVVPLILKWILRD